MSANWSVMSCSVLAMSASVIASNLRPLRRNDSTDSSIERIWSRSSSMRLRWVSSSMNSERRRILVIGVRRSWLIAASILVRSSMPSCEKARAMSAESRGRSDAGAAPSSCTAAASWAVAAVRRRLRPVGPLQQETRGDDQMKRCDRDDDEGCDLAADAAQVQQALHDQ